MKSGTKDKKAKGKSKAEKVGTNMQMTVDKEAGTLTIVVDLTQSNGRSSTGKTIQIASSQGNKKFSGPEDVDMFVGLNVYRYPAEDEKDEEEEEEEEDDEE